MSSTIYRALSGQRSCPHNFPSLFKLIVFHYKKHKASPRNRRRLVQ